MDFNLKDKYKVVIVGGASKGLGPACAEGLGRACAEVLASASTCAQNELCKIGARCKMQGLTGEGRGQRAQNVR